MKHTDPHKKTTSEVCERENHWIGRKSDWKLLHPATQLHMVHHMWMICDRLCSICGFPAQGVAGHRVRDLAKQLGLQETTVQRWQGQAQNLKASAAALVDFHLANRRAAFQAKSEITRVKWPGRKTGQKDGQVMQNMIWHSKFEVVSPIFGDISNSFIKWLAFGRRSFTSVWTALETGQLHRPQPVSVSTLIDFDWLVWRQITLSFRLPRPQSDQCTTWWFRNCDDPRGCWCCQSTASQSPVATCQARWGSARRFGWSQSDQTWRLEDPTWHAQPHPEPHPNCQQGIDSRIPCWFWRGTGHASAILQQQPCHPPQAVWPNRCGMLAELPPRCQISSRGKKDRRDRSRDIIEITFNYCNYIFNSLTYCQNAMFTSHQWLVHMEPPSAIGRLTSFIF